MLAPLSSIELDEAHQQSQSTAQLPVSHDSAETPPAIFSEDVNETSPAGHRAERSWLRLWMWELAAIASAVGILVAIGIILSVHDGKPLPPWPLGLNLNSLVAILTTFLRALIMVFIAEVICQLKWDWFREPRSLYDLNRFESASRGVWGSLLVLACTRYNGLTVLCAFLTIISLGAGPVAQQAINSTTC
ncbi:hypothetical protein QBC34DRAFT_314080, partial [Podospora aff. communis PSN243]